MTEMRLKSLDRARWKAISEELEALLDEMADLNSEYEFWPTGSVAVECYESLSRASLLAIFASADPEATVKDLRPA